LHNFLVDQFGAAAIRLSDLHPRDIARFVERYTVGLAPVTIKAAGITLRRYFCFKRIFGAQVTALIAAIPRVALWRMAGIPQTLSADDVRRLLRAFDRHTATGKRDYAITRCLLDLGLRRTEVASLLLEDVHWRQGTLRIHAKSKRVDVMPLPQATGLAIVDYLRHGRPPTKCRQLFVRHHAPTDTPPDVDIVRNAVRYAARRCGLQQRIRGTHVLRHTLAGRLVQQGVRFKEIADVLRHRSLDTTTIYAKVDLHGLARVAMPWPGRRS
jgi:integrase